MGDSATGRSQQANPGLPGEQRSPSPKSVFAATLETERPRRRAGGGACPRHVQRAACEARLPAPLVTLPGSR